MTGLNPIISLNMNPVKKAPRGGEEAFVDETCHRLDYASESGIRSSLNSSDTTTIIVCSVDFHYKMGVQYSVQSA